MDALESMTAYAESISDCLEGPDRVSREVMQEIRRTKHQLLQDMIDAGVKVPRHWETTQFVWDAGGPDDDIGGCINKDPLSGLLESVERAIEKHRAGQVGGIKRTFVGRLHVNLDAMTITLDGKVHEVQSKQALRWVNVLADNPEAWISSTSLVKYDKELDGARTWDLKKKLPRDVVKLIKTSRKLGSQLSLRASRTKR